ncbi:MAG: hypothetical protein A3I14_02640 [Candidatus Rokubacteria bacterium RIFCSPLOWO2_02_FULL_73_56]|nr:MAG: hypothetical protein A3I14_02640 [Candidatus Rokubacteria bacterium RIFCSPLOWO2_02_FULL_73_56]
MDRVTEPQDRTAPGRGAVCSETTVALVEEIVRLRSRVAELAQASEAAAPCAHDAGDEAKRWVADIGRIFCQTLDAPTVANQIALSVRGLLDARMAIVWALDPESGAVRAIAVSGALEPAFDAGLELPAGAGVIGLTLRQRQPTTTRNLLTDPRVELTPELRALLERAPYRSVLAVPLSVQDRIIGALGIGDVEGRAFTADEVDLARTFADQAAVALEHARLYEAAQQRLRRSETLVNVSRALNSTLDLTEVMRRIARETCRAVGADMVGAFVAGDEARVLRPVAGYRVPKDLLGRFLAHPIPLRGHPILEEAWREGRPAWSSDVTTDPRVDQESVAQFPHRSSLFFPIAVRGEPVGAFFVAWLHEPHAFTLEETALVEAISDQAALAFENAQLHAETARRLAHAETLVAVSRAVNSSLDRTEVLRRATRELVRALGADMGLAYGYGPDRGTARPLAGYRVPRELLATSVTVPSTAALVVELEASSAPICSSDSQADARFAETWARLVPHRSILAVGIRVKGELAGGISVLWTGARHGFAADDARLAEAIAEQAGIALEGARALELERALRRRQDAVMTLSHEVASEHDLDRLLQRVAARSADLMGADAALLLLLEGDELRFRGAIGVDEALLAIGRLDVRTSLTGVVVRECRPLVCPDLAAEPGWRDGAIVRRFEYRAMLAVPMIYQGRALGVLKLLHREPRSFCAEDVDFLGALATEAALAIANARLIEDEARARREAETIADLVRAINGSLDLDTTLGRVAEAAQQLCGSDVARIALREPGGPAMTIRHAAGIHRPLSEFPRIEAGRGAGGHVLLTGQPFRTPRRLEDPRVGAHHRGFIEGEGIVAQMVVPIAGEGRTEGLLFVDNRSARAFTDHDEAILTRLAEHAALAIGNAQRFAREQAARAASEASEQRFRDLVESLDAIVWEADAETCGLTFVSRSAEALLGYPAARWLAEPAFVAEHLHPDDREATVALCRAATLDAADHQLEYRMIGADGRIVWIHDTVRVLRDADGRGRLLRGVKVDITALKRAQQHREIQFGVTRLLAEAPSLEAALPRLLEGICTALGWPLGEVWRVDADAGLLRWSGSWHDPAGDFAEFVATAPTLTFARGEGLVGQAWERGAPVWMSDVTTNPAFRRAALAARQGLRGAFAFPIRAVRGITGVLVFYSRRASPPDDSLLQVVDDLGRQIGQFIERKQAEDALARSEAQYRSLVEGAVHGIARTNRGGRFLAVNRALVTMLGYESEAELLALDLARDVYADPAERLRVIEGSRKAAQETQWKRKDGTLVTVRLSGPPTRDADGHTTGFEIIVEDVTARRQLEEQLRQAQKMEAIGQLAGGVAHDFNNLLTVIIGRSQLLLDRLARHDGARRDVELAHKAATRAATLTRQLLAFSRKQVLQPKVLDLGEVVSGMGKLLARLIGEHIRLVVRPGPGPLRVNADQGQLEQVIMNLAVNARDAMPEGGQLVLETSRVAPGQAPPALAGQRGALVLLEVTDDGCGMDAETRRRVFEPFFTTKEPGKGTGLGLATVYGIVTQSGGHIDVESWPGRGTRFRVWLPGVEVAVDPAAAAPAADRLQGTETVLVVEDEPDVREMTCEALERYGYTVLSAGHPFDALELSERHAAHIHLLLTDVVMPGMSGYELARRVAAARPDLRLLFMSGYASGSGDSGELTASRAPLLGKPFVPETLIRKVREVLEA